MNIESVLFFSISILIFSILFIFPTVTYEILEDSIKMKWKVFKFILIGSRTIKITNIQEIRKFIFKKDILPGGYIWGNLLIKKGVIIVLNKRLIRFSFFKRIFITPKNPDEFIKEINNKLKCY